MQKQKNKRLMVAITGLVVQLLQPQAMAQSDREPLADGDSPSRELLEFLIEYGDSDNESFDIMVFHGKQDRENSNAQQQDQVDTTAEPAAAPQFIQEPVNAY